MVVNKKHLGLVKGGEFVPHHPSEYHLNLSKYEGKEIEVAINRKRKKRSLNQNDYLWGVVYALISEETGLTPEEVHDAMKIKFLRHTKNGIMTAVSTTKLTTVQFEKYAENIRRWAGEFLGMFIPLPNERFNFN